MASSSSPPPQWNYDVFLSFRGEDTRKNFVDHLYSALHQKGIYAFKDDEKLERGKSISPELIKAIKESRIAVIVFSTNYASSTWCLEELVEIIQCKSTTGQTVLPIFYNVDPSRVRQQKKSFQKAFLKHEETFGEDHQKVKSWRNALVEAANLSGYDLKEIANGQEAQFIQKFVQEIMKKLGRHIPLYVTKFQVGIDSRVNKVITLLDNGKKDVHIVGLCGVGGIGKTTIAKAVFNRKSGEFENHCFLANVREESKEHGLAYLQQKLLKEILKEGDLNICDVGHGINVIKRRLQHKKVLVVIDDVNSLEQLESLAGENDWFGHGSEIIITTRDKRVLEQCDVLDHEIYMVELFNYNEALQFFSWHAFKKNSPEENYLELSRSVIHYAQGLPLALQVLGSLLFKSIEYWKKELERLKKIPNKKIYEVLKISFDGLEDTEKDLFLDIACFFKGYHEDEVMSILDNSGRIEFLKERSLVTTTILDNKILWMHDLIQEMGLEIIREESPDDPSKRSRLYSRQDIYKVLEENKGTEKIKGIMLNRPHHPLSEELHVSVDVFVKMTNLKVLKLSGIRPRGRLTYLSNELRYLHWEDYPERFLPSNFHPKNLVQLHLPGSQIQQIPMDIKFMGKLKHLSFRRSPYLGKFPDLSNFPHLEELDLMECKNLVEVQLSSGVHERLVRVDLLGCEKLSRLPRSIKLKKLTYFCLEGCSKLEKFPDVQEGMDSLEDLCLSFTAIKDLPPSMERLTGLQTLELEGCYELKSIPNNIFSGMKDLYKLCVSGPDICKQLPSSILHLNKLNSLHIFSYRKRWPKSFQRGKRTNVANSTYLQLQGSLCNLTHLALHRCNLSEESLSSFGHLSLLQYLDVSENNFASIPASFEQLTRLTHLYLTHCTSLRKLTSLPSSIMRVDATGCKSLEQCCFPPSAGSPDHREFNFTNCYNMPNLLSQSQLQETGTIIVPGSEISQWFNHKCEAEGSDGFFLVDDHPPSYNNVKGIVFCFVLEGPRKTTFQSITFKLHIIGESGTPFHETVRAYNIASSDHIIFIRKTKYYDVDKKVGRPIKDLLRRRSIGVPNIPDDASYIQASLYSYYPEENIEIKKLGVHLIMEEEQVETSGKGLSRTSHVN